MTKRKFGFLAVALVLSTIVFFSACSKGNLSGKYGHNKNPGWEMELFKNGKGYLKTDEAESFDYSAEGNTLLITHIAGGARGTIDGNKITFHQVSENDIVGSAFKGTWTKK